VYLTLIGKELVKISFRLSVPVGLCAQRVVI